ncbi:MULTISPECIES: phosphatidate cytidylyltransferase [unclassified Bacillus (in: firmicutes)]|uniref:phosphatidate cytidylyltransferase n=1 Tax=unclassified Bacillus (in: firmicutes) TaxID=185979 RepID=UPI0008E968A4|nr:MULTISPECIES: phosphatidate cytidylyltransferase [unclassified Bacillus (in: firmicutes)]SFA73621.1 phosphatidate cytidylyltransferase [Bacillus sp. UNCCL13]SFQ63803.1 phosphatidate cytidylyltransferase [Bacillus sp. cl95]
MKQRIITGVVAGAIFLSIIVLGGFPVVLLAYLLASVGLYELLKMRKISLTSFPGIAAMLFLWVMMLPEQYDNLFNVINYSKAEIAFIGILLFLTYTVATKNRFTFDDAGFVFLAAVYVGTGFFFLIQTRDAGLIYVFYSLFIIWATDSGAYFIGKAMGKRKLWPEISPNKTVEGFLGGIFCAVVVAVLFILFADMDVSAIKLIVITIILSVSGQIGDLAQSAYKRHYGVKDSGNLLPGHGGILDRFDSLLFVWPLIHFLHLFQ